MSTPKPLCQCPVCKEAREKGYPYARCGCSLYLKDIGLLVDTPEDITVALNNADIRVVDTIAYSHWDPDHTLGMRVVEQLRLKWLDYYENLKPQTPVRIIAHPKVMEDVTAISSKYGSFMSYYEGMKLAQLQTVEDCFWQDGVRVSLVQVPKEKAVTVFVFESGGKKLIYAPCDCVPFPRDRILHDAHVLILGNTFIGDTLKGGRHIGPDHPLRKELHSFEQALDLRRSLGARRLIITHIEEDWGKSYDDLRRLEKDYENVMFAYDGLKIVL